MVPCLQMEAMKWLRARSPPCKIACQTYTAAARGGHIDMLQYIERTEPVCTQDWEWAGTMAILHGRLSALQHLITTHRESPAIHPDLQRSWASWIQFAAQAGHNDIVEYLLDGDMTSMLKLAPASKGKRAQEWVLNDTPDRPISLPLLNKLAEHGLVLGRRALARLTEHRRRYCTAKGLVRWCERRLTQPRRLRGSCKWACSPRASLLYAVASLPKDVLDQVFDHAGLGPVPFETPKERPHRSTSAACR